MRAARSSASTSPRGRLETVCESCDGRRLIGPNDLVFDSEGGLWFTDHGCTTADGRRFGALCYAADGSASAASATGCSRPTASASRRTAAPSTSPTPGSSASGPSTSRRRACSPRRGLAPGRVVANLPDYQLLDSLAVEADGRVCVATIVNGGITAIEPDGTIEHFPFPDPICTNICFGGDDLRDAWITASGTGRLYKARWPRPGLKLAFNA